MRSWLALVLAAAAVPFAGCGGCGDDGGGAADGGGFVLLSRAPDPDADNVYVFDTIFLRFSRPLDPDSVSDTSIALEANGEPVPHDTFLSEEQDAVEIYVTAPPATPAEMTVSIGSELTDWQGTPFAGDSWSFSLPAWQYPPPAGPIGDGARPQLAIGLYAAPAVALHDADGRFSVHWFPGGEWTEFEPPLGPGSEIRLAGDGRTLAAAVAVDGGVQLHQRNDVDWDFWGQVTTAGIDARPLFDVAIDADGHPVVAVFTDSAVQVARSDGTSLVNEAPLEGVASVRELALAVDGTRAVVALVSGAGVLRTFHQTDGGWQELTGGVDFTSAERPDVAAKDGVIALSWQKDDAGDLATRHAYAARWNGESWLRFAHAADLDLQADAVETAIALDGEEVVMTWVEADLVSRKVYAARATTDDENWTLFHSAVNRDPGADATFPSVALGEGGPVVAFVEKGELVLARWNGSPTLRPGLAERLPAGDCAIPEDAPPATLAETGCYADVAGHQLAPQLVPFEINSPLWSDGALKRRFLLIPDGQSIGSTDAGALTMPVGTLLVKEFWLERIAEQPTSRFPVETRFLVKRCEEGDCIEPWQGYSYRWNPEGSEAALIDPGSADERTEWTVTDAGGQEVAHSHIYPARLNCTRCHNAPAGRVLGLQLAQLDRPARYGDLVADQLDTLTAIGVLAAPGGNAATTRLPSSLDPSYDYQSRSRAYYHINCASCHRPGGERPTIDLRFEAPLAADNICNQLTPGNGTGSNLYIKDATRGAGQMPPLATDLPDDYQLATTAAWIDGMASCP